MKNPIILGSVLFIIDQITKYLVSVYSSYGSSINIIALCDFFNIVNVKNTGMAFSMMQNRNCIFTITIFLTLTCIIIFLCRSWRKLNSLWQYSLCMIVSGGLGNLVDRILRGAVVDFLDFGINSLRWPSFNIADSCIFVSVCILIFDEVIFKRKKV